MPARSLSHTAARACNSVYDVSLYVCVVVCGCVCFLCWARLYPPLCSVNTFLQQISKLQEKLAARTAGDGKPTANKKQD